LSNGNPVDQASAPPDMASSWLEAIVESIDDAIVGKNLSGIVTSWNNAAQRMFGYSAAEIIGHPITLIIPPHRIAEEVAILERIHQGERIDHVETERQRKDGSLIPVVLTISPIRDNHGVIIGVSKIARDLSEQQRAHMELRHREALLSSIIDTVPDALIVIDDRAIIQSFSKAAERLFGYPAADVVGHNVSMLMPSPYREEHDSYVARYLATGIRRIIGIGRVVVGQRRDGSTFPMELQVGAVNLPGQTLFTGFVRDLTEPQDRERRLHELQAELIHVSRLNELGQMVSALAHEVNQPLAAMANYLNGARRLFASGNTEAAQRALDLVSEQSERARQIIRRLRDLVRKGDSEHRRESLPVVIQEASALALIGVGQKLKLDIRVADNAAEAVIDKIQIQQVLLNLMRNAVEAMAGSERRELSITTRRAGERVEIGVADTGPGLPDTVRERLFQPFVTTKADGMGVGLSVCRAIVEAHGGEMRAETAPGGGTAFIFTVPYGTVRPDAN
jgi:two-component system sensor kinase FixL